MVSSATRSGLRCPRRWTTACSSTGEDQGGAIVGGGEPGNLTVYFDTADIDASLAKVRELGGNAEDKMPVPGFGWFAACHDTEGNAFSLWQGDESAA